MNTSIVFVALVTAATARADPEPVAVVSAGARLGYIHGFVDALSVEGVGKGDARSFNPNGPPDEMTYPGSYVTARAGVEARSCVTDAVCALGGVDVGYLNVDFSGQEFVGTTPTKNVGSRNLRFRPEVDALVGPRRFEGVELSAAIAYPW